MPKSQKLSKPRKPLAPNKDRYYSEMIIEKIPNSAPLIEVISLLNEIEKPEECRMYVVRIERIVFNEVEYNIAIKEYNFKLEEYNKKMEKYLKEKIEQEETKRSENIEQEEAKKFEKLDNFGKRFSLLDLD